jgi:hypothetical protein
MHLAHELLTLRPDGDIDTMEEYLAVVKNLGERIDAMSVTLTPDRRTLLVLMMGLGGSEHFGSLTHIWSLIPMMTADKAISMLREEVTKIKAEGTRCAQ